ncbi:lanthionine synthetase LanC family protein [Kribbella lupini]|uniref:Lanthionine synthetase-like protein n=1 Tax=Kribbella lupini TaxID=291602 RepID=A0ABN2B1K4_9ACTN
MSSAGATYRDTAEAAWQWTLGQVRWADDGPWIPTSVTGDEPQVPDDRDGMHSGIAGLAHTLAEIRLSRPWTAAETKLGDAIAERLIREIPGCSDVTFFDGLVSTIGALVALDRLDGVRAAVVRLQELAADDGWPQTLMVPPRFAPGARIHDMTLGTAGVLLGGVWAARHGVEGGRELADHAAGILLTEIALAGAEAEAEVGAGVDAEARAAVGAEVGAIDVGWPFVPRRFRPEAGAVMPNLSHGLAGVAAALASAGLSLGRPELVAAATKVSEQLVSLGVTDGRGFIVQRYIPTEINDEDEFTYTWCHGASGTSLAFAALDAAGVKSVAGTAPADWRARCLHSVRTSGLPARLHPGFWDNDGRCCGTAGVGDILLDSWHRTGSAEDLAFATLLADTLVEHAFHEGGTYWRFTEHRNENPLLPPAVGWMQGAAGIAAYLLHTARVVEQGTAAQPQQRMDTWWAAPADAHH